MLAYISVHTPAHTELQLITKKAVATCAASMFIFGGKNDASKNNHLCREKMKRDDEDCEEVEYLPPLWDADEDVPVEDLNKLFYESFDSNFEEFYFWCMIIFNQICQNKFCSISTDLS